MNNAGLETNYLVYTLFEDILNSYVCDYYVEDHWKKLPSSWQSSCNNISIKQMIELLDFTKPPKLYVYPLSLLSVRCLISHNVIKRKRILIESSVSNQKFQNLFWKNVKLKKRHEIGILAELCYKSAIKTGCFSIVDVGSGLGHLSRLLAFKYGFKVCTFEANAELTKSAKILDDRFVQSLKKYKINYSASSHPVHVNQEIASDINCEYFTSKVKKAFNDNTDNLTFGIVGLHPCGDLGPTLLRLFSECSLISFINMASCCYMKLTLSPSSSILGFPLSEFAQNRSWNLSYLSCEIACHAIENFLGKLKNNDFTDLKIHAYRAALEKILISHDPNLKHSIINPMKYRDNLTFKKYCLNTFEKFDITIPDNTLMLYDELINDTWHNVIVFYSLRLLFAPLIESIILLDRQLYLQENTYKCIIIPAFDCCISPRNHVIVCLKNKNV